MNAIRSQRFIIIFTALFLASAAGALASYELKTVTPEVDHAIAARQARYSNMQVLKAQGSVGENNRGYTEIIKPAPGAGDIVAAENQDRQTIYSTIAIQNNLGASGLGIVETVFAEVQRDKTRPGDWIQMPSGDWVQKS